MILTASSRKRTASSQKKRAAAAIIRATANYRADPFGFWLRRHSPEWIWSWNYQVFIRQQLLRVESGEINRLMLFVPPRHGKSEMVTVRYPVFRLHNNPHLRVIIGAYNQTLSDKFSRKARRLTVSSGIELSRDRTAVEDWETSAGGGVRSVGVGGGITGQGGDLIVIDDPVKNREEANSKNYRDKVYDWYTDDLYTRLEPGAAMILIMTRWHEDDLAGRILASEDGPSWQVISLPAEAEPNDPLGRNPGDPLCPERYNLQDLARIKTVLGKSYYALYQQRPMEQEGDMFKRSWFEIVDEAPAEAQRVRYWDRGASTDGDYTVGTLLAKHSGRYCVEDVIRGQWQSMERNQVILQTAQLDRERGHVQIWIEQEPGSSGVDSVNEVNRILDGFAVRADKVSGDKVTRADPFASQCEAGNVTMKRGRWNEAWIDELTAFPMGANDDQVDSASGAYNKLAGGVDAAGAVEEIDLSNYKTTRRR